MTRHPHITLPGGRNNAFEEVGDAFPIVLMRHSPEAPRGQALPVAFQSKSIVDAAAATWNLPVPPIRDYLAVVRNNLDAYLSCLADIANNDVDFASSFGAFPQFVDVVRVHTDGLKDHTVPVAIVFDPLQFIQIPIAVGRFRNSAVMCFTPCRRLYSRFLFRVDVASHDAVVVSTDVHHCLPYRLLRYCDTVTIDSWNRDHSRKRNSELSSINHAALR